jgi:hypothetical protein
MSTRLSVDLLVIGLLGGAVAWAARAPADPPARAAYLCAPVIAASTMAYHLQYALAEESNVVPPTPPWQLDAGRVCLRVVVRVSEDLGN